MSAVTDAVPVADESIAEAKAHLRIEGDDEDGLIGRLIGAATALCESFTGTQLLARPVRETIPVGAEWRRLSVTPVRAIVSMVGLGADGVSFTLPAEAYGVDIDANGDGWVRVTQPGTARRVTIQYEAGQAEGWADLPETLRQGITRLAAHFYSHRDAADDAGPPAAVAALWRPWRRMRLR